MYGQSMLKGSVRDTVLDEGCRLAVIVLMQADSMIVQYTRSGKDGSFAFQNIKAGSYQLLITHPSYSEYVLSVLVKDSLVTDLGKLALSPQAKTLSTVIVTPKVLPRKMNGDTLEYNTMHMKTRVNATVEELLAHLPGVQVDQNGVITVNGKKIDRLLVDGEDFFGGDPTIVTRNFNADMIAKIQVLDKKSSQADFTGVDDGQKTKTLNLTLKEDSKRGYFIKTEMGGDKQGYYNVNELMGSFKGKRQFAVLGIMANTGVIGFSGNEQESGLNVGGRMNDALAASAGIGIPRVTAGGMHYANKWNDKEAHALGDYSYGHLVTNPISSLITRQTLPGAIYIQQQQSSSVNTQDQHRLKADYEYSPDTVSDFHFSLEGISKNGYNEFASLASSFNDTLVNSSSRTIHSSVGNQDFHGSIMWRIRGRTKKTRIFSVLADLSELDNSTKGSLYSLNNFYRSNGGRLHTDTIDQRKLFSTSGFDINSSFNYTESLWRDIIIGISYGVSFSRSRSSQATYCKGDSKYDKIIDSLTSNYQSDVFTQRTTINMQNRGKKLSYTIGGDIRHYVYRQSTLMKDSFQRYLYLNFTPRVNTRYSIDSYTGFNFEYNGEALRPSIVQLQAVPNNNDPLHIIIGNPNLRPGFSHNFSLGFYNLQPLVINAHVNVGFITNTISTRTIVDSQGRQISQSVNVNGSRNVETYFYISTKIKPINVNLALSTTFSYSGNVNYVNAYLSKNDSYNTGGGLNIYKVVTGKYYVQWGTNFNYFYSRSTIYLSSPTRYWAQNHNILLYLFFFKGFEIQTGVFYNWRQKLDNFDKKNASLLWNAYMLRNFFSNHLSVKWQISDILGQNTGISRNTAANLTTESTFNTLGRFWLLTASYRFIRHGKLN